MRRTTSVMMLMMRMMFMIHTTLPIREFPGKEHESVSSFLLSSIITPGREKFLRVVKPAGEFF